MATLRLCYNVIILLHFYLIYPMATKFLSLSCIVVFMSASHASHFTITKKDGMVELECPKPKTTLKADIDCPRVSGHSIITLDGKQGVIRQNGSLSIAIIYDEISIYNDNLAKVRLGDKWGLASLNTGIELTPIHFDDMGLLFEDRITVKRGDKAGHIDTLGNITTPMIYGDAYRFEHGLAYVTNDGNVKDDTYRVGLVGLDGKERLAPIYRHIIVNHDGQQVIFETDDRLEGVAEPSGKVVIEPVYKNLGFFYHGYASAGLFYDEFYGYIDPAGTEIIEPQYYKATNPQLLGDQVVFFVARRVNREVKWGAVDARNRTVIDFIYDRLLGVDGDVVIAERKGRATLLDAQGREKFPPRYRSIFPFSGDTSFYMDESSEQQRLFYGILDKHGKELSAAIYDDITFMYDDHNVRQPTAYQVKYQGKFGVLNLKGHQLIAPEYDDIYDANNGNLYLKQGERYAIYDKKSGKRIQPPSYSYIYPLIDGYTKVKKPNEAVWYLLDKHGKLLGRTSAPSWYKSDAS